MTAYVMAGGTRIPVTGFALRGGKMILTCETAGPVPESAGDVAVTVFGEDGIGFGQGYCRVSWQEVRPGEMLALVVAMGLERCYGDAETAV